MKSGSNAGFSFEASLIFILIFYILPAVGFRVHSQNLFFGVHFLDIFFKIWRKLRRKLLQKKINIFFEHNTERYTGIKGDTFPNLTNLILIQVKKTIALCSFLISKSYVCIDF